jgi:hypothetical protein
MIKLQVYEDDYEELMDYAYFMGVTVSPVLTFVCHCGAARLLDYNEVWGSNRGRKTEQCVCGRAIPLVKYMMPGEKGLDYRLGLHGIPYDIRRKIHTADA